MSALYPIPRQTRQAFLTATALQTAFGPFEFKLWDALDVEVFTKAPGGSSWVLVASDAYTVAAVSTFPGVFTLTFDTGLAADTQVWVRGKRLHQRLLDVTQGGSLNSVDLEKELDRQTIVMQEVRRDLDALLGGTVPAIALASGIGNDSPAPGGTVASALEGLDGRVTANASAISDAQADIGELQGAIATFGTAGDLAAVVMPSEAEFVRLAGYAAPGDGGGALYKRAPVQSTGLGKVQSADGAWWEIAEFLVTAAMFSDDAEDAQEFSDAQTPGYMFSPVNASWKGRHIFRNSPLYDLAAGVLAVALVVPLFGGTAHAVASGKQFDHIRLTQPDGPANEFDLLHSSSIVGGYTGFLKASSLSVVNSNLYAVNVGVENFGDGNAKAIHTTGIAGAGSAGVTMGGVAEIITVATSAAGSCAWQVQIGPDAADDTAALILPGSSGARATYVIGTPVAPIKIKYAFYQAWMDDIDSDANARALQVLDKAGNEKAYIEMTGGYAGPILRLFGSVSGNMAMTANANAASAAIVWGQSSGTPAVVADSPLSIDTTLGKITLGVVPGSLGGTGVANTGKTITLGGNLETSGAFALTLTLGAATNVTLPSTGTLSTLGGSETLTNKTISSGSTYNAGAVTSSGNVSGAALIPTGSTKPTAGIYLPAANVLRFSANSVDMLNITSALVSIGWSSSLLGSETLSVKNFMTVGNTAAPGFLLGDTGSGTAVVGGLGNFDVEFRRNNLEAMRINSSGLSLASGKALQVNGTQVVGARDTGWTAMTGTANENTAYDTASVTLAQLAGRVMALQAALTTHGLIGT